MNDLNQQKAAFYKSLGIYSAAGIQLATSVVVGLYLGNLADRKLHTDPWITLVGLIFGAIAGIYNLIRILNWQQKGE